MRILCKEKDFYDYVGYGENSSEDVTFDRRNMWMIKREGEDADYDTIYHVIDTLLTDRERHAEGVIGIFIGYALYIVKLTATPRETSYDSVKPFKYSAELIAARKCYDIKHSLPIEFVKIETSIYDYSFWRLKSWKSYTNAQKDEDFLIKEYKEGNVANWKLKPAFEKSWAFVDINGKIPILKNTFVPKLIDAKEVYYNIEEWLISQYNDVDQESEGLTDVDKAINHGFDKRSSFRNVKD